MKTAAPKLSLASIAATVCLGNAAQALESSATNFPSGVNTALSAVYPPAGATEYYNYNLFYDASKYSNTANNPSVPGLHTNIYVEAFRINHTWLDITPNITFGSGFAFNAAYQTLHVGGRRFDGGLQVADPDLIPYNLDFHVLPNLWVAHILNVFPGIGQYSKNDVVNGGVGYTTVSPEVALTWLPGKWELSLDAHYDFNSRNNQTRYQSGNTLGIDYNVNYQPFDALPGLKLGVSGFLFDQLQDDTAYGNRVGDGNRARAFAYGPLVRYDIGHGGLLLKWQHETDVVNRSKGERIWLQFAVPLPL